MGNLICASCRACPEIKESVTTVAVYHHDDRYTGSQPPQQTTTAIVSSTGPLPSSSPQQPAAAAASHDHSKQRSFATTDCTFSARQINAKVATTVENADISRKYLPPNGINTAWEFYLSPELQACLSHKTSCEDVQLVSDIEKVARGIVDVNLFITSQVIMPALERYVQEINEEQLNPDHIMVNMDNTDGVTADDDDCRVSFDRRHSDGLTICVDNGAGIHLVDRVTIY